MKLTHGMLQAMGTLEGGVALNSYQLKLLGLGWPPRSGWVRRLVGMEVSEDKLLLLMRLRGTKKRERRRILAGHGLTPVRLFHSKTVEIGAVSEASPRARQFRQDRFLGEGI